MTLQRIYRLVIGIMGDIRTPDRPLPDVIFVSVCTVCRVGFVPYLRIEFPMLESSHWGICLKTLYDFWKIYVIMRVNCCAVSLRTLNGS